MQFKTKLKLWFAAIISSLAIIVYLAFNMEFVQKKVFDIKADITGSARTITFYAPLTTEKVASFSDKDMRYETKPTGAISVWLGSQSKKVESNLGYIIEDTK